MQYVVEVTPGRVALGNAEGIVLHENLAYLAQGDSWFSFGSFPFSKTNNLLMYLKLKKKALVVNCAKPGADLVDMTKSRSDQSFLDMFSFHSWNGILLSAGGNDLIAAAQKNTGPASRRILLTQEERGTGSSVERYISPEGWAAFANNLISEFKKIERLRDAKGSLCVDVPIYVHSYDYATPRLNGKKSQWLHKACELFAVPEKDRLALSKHLLKKLESDVLTQTGVTNLHVISTLGTLKPSKTSDTGNTEHWANEIHPNPTGYKLIAEKVAAVLNAQIT